MQDLARQGLVMTPQRCAATSPWCWGLVFEYSKSIRRSKDLRNIFIFFVFRSIIGELEQALNRY